AGRHPGRPRGCSGDPRRAGGQRLAGRRRAQVGRHRAPPGPARTPPPSGKNATVQPPACSPRPRSSAPGTAPGTVTVAELIARCSGMPVPPRRTTGPEGAVSVAALLRREGRGPRVADRPLAPRGHARVASPPPPPPRRTGRQVIVAARSTLHAQPALRPY